MKLQILVDARSQLKKNNTAGFPSVTYAGGRAAGRPIAALIYTNGDRTRSNFKRTLLRTHVLQYRECHVLCLFVNRLRESVLCTSLLTDLNVSTISFKTQYFLSNLQFQSRDIESRYYISCNQHSKSDYRVTDGGFACTIIIAVRC